MSGNLTENERKTLENVKKHKELELYFFQKLSSKKDVKWLEPLKENGFFDNENIPVCKEGHNIQSWDILSYIKSIIKDLVKNDADNDIEYILDVILCTAELSNNFRVFEQSMEILIYIPSKYYDESYFKKLIDHWLKNEFELTFTLHNLAKILMPYLAKYDKEKSFVLFEKFIEKFIELDRDREFVFESLFSNDELISDIAKSNFENTLNLLVSILERKLEKSHSERKFGNISFEIKANRDKYVFAINERKIIEFDFEGRVKDIERIKSSVSEEYPTIKEDELDRNIKLLYSNLFVNEAFTSIFNGEKYLYEAKDYLIYLIKKIIKFSSDKSIETCEIIEAVFNSKYDLVIKIGLFIIYEEFEEYGRILLDKISNNDDVVDYIFRYYIFEDELKHILESIKTLDDVNAKKIEKIIEKGQYIKHEWDAEYIDKWKQKRYFALKNIEYFNEKHNELKMKTGLEVELQPAMGSIKSGFVKQKSPLSEEEIFQLSNEELINEMLRFRESRSFDEDFSQLSYRGFGEVIKKVIKMKPERFLNDLGRFNKIQYAFVGDILDAFKELFKENRIDDYQKIIEFIIAYTDPQSFWNDEYCYEENNHLATHTVMLKGVFWFIIEYLQNDKLSFSINEYKETLNFIKRYTVEMKLNEKEEVLFGNNDYNLYFFNSATSLFLRALIELALKIKRCEIEGNDTKWKNDLKVIFEECLNSESIDAYFLLGEYISNLTYIDKTWLVEKMKSIDTQEPGWEFFISGYLYSRTIYGDYFEIMKENMSNALSYNFKDKNIKGRLAEHITFAYLNGFDKDDEIFKEMISLWDSEMIERAIETCYSINKRNFAQEVSIELVKLKVLRLWNEVVNKYKGKLETEITRENITIIKSSVKLLDNFDKLESDIEKNIRFSFGFIKNDFNTYNVVKYFNKLIKLEGNEVNEQSGLSLMGDFLHTCTPRYPDKEIKVILEHLNIMTNSDKILEDILEAYMNEGSGRSSIAEYIPSQLLKKE